MFDDGTSRPSDSGRWSKVWNSSLITTMIAFHNRMQGQPMEVLATDPCALLLRRSDTGIVAINKCDREVSFDVDTRLRFKWNHRYTEVFTKKQLPPIQGPSYTFSIPASTAQMWIAD